ncbi:hypothetical protein HOY80DRAFT_1070474 [Tuber brumale]|nr:hypothetical protein HOY80DRAFT_1070474 [Tuber brumale]
MKTHLLVGRDWDPADETRKSESVHKSELGIGARVGSLKLLKLRFLIFRNDVPFRLAYNLFQLSATSSHLVECRSPGLATVLSVFPTIPDVPNSMGMDGRALRPSSKKTAILGVDARVLQSWYKWHLPVVICRTQSLPAELDRHLPLPGTSHIL